jgi:hypothetical protein
MKWPFKGRQRSGQYQLLPPGQPVQLNHYVSVEGRDSARLIAEHLTGTFSTSVGLSPTDNGIGVTRYQVKASHRYIPEVGKGEKTTAEMALTRAQKLISELVVQFGGKYVGWDRTPMSPEHKVRKDDDGDDSQNSMGPPLPIFS